MDKESSVLNAVKEQRKNLFESWIIDFISILLVATFFILFACAFNAHWGNPLFHRLEMYVVVWFTVSMFIECIFNLNSLYLINKWAKEVISQHETK